MLTVVDVLELVDDAGRVGGISRVSV